MSVVDTSASTARISYVEWAPIFAGAVAATALSFLLLTFGSAVGTIATSFYLVLWFELNHIVAALMLGSLFFGATALFPGGSKR